MPQKVLDAERSISEDPVLIQGWFERLKEVIDDYALQPTDIWNMDETGFQIGFGKNGFCVTRRRRKRLLAIPSAGSLL